MKGECFLLLHGLREEGTDRLASRIAEKGGTVAKLRGDVKDALDLGREAFFKASAGGVGVTVAGCGDTCAVAIAIAQICPVAGLICVSPAKPRGFRERVLQSKVAGNLFLIVAPTVLAIDGRPSQLAARMIDQIPDRILRVIDTESTGSRYPETENAILEQLRNIRDTKKLVIRQTLGV